jgi:hypothetical protein
MGHIVFGAPGIDRFHLHERLHRELRFRGHRVSWLCADPIAATFAGAQAMPVVALPHSPGEATRAPVDELAELECLRLGEPATDRRRRRRAASLHRLLPAARHFFETWSPDLLLLHGARTGVRRLLHFAARECGSEVLWTGPGLLPHTLQFDGRGLDAESSVLDRKALDYRSQRSDAPLLAAAAAALMARAAPLPLSRRAIAKPAIGARLRDAALAALQVGPAGAMAALRAWRQALPGAAPATTRAELPRDPFACVLLQRNDDPRIRLDARQAPGPAELVRTVRNAAQRLDPSLPVVAVLPQGGVPERELAQLRDMSGVLLELHGSAPEAVALAMATITINHPLGAASLLVGTPLLHLASALYQLERVAVRTRLDTLAADLPRALQQDHPALRNRFLAYLLTRAHVWCCAEEPDHNGIAGLVQVIEGHVRGAASGERLSYRAGPSWPLAAGAPAP